MNIILMISEIICNTLLSPELIDRARTRKGAFTRNCGKLPYWTMIKLLLKNSKESISSTLEEFFKNLRLQSGLSISDTICCSQQAFSKARAGIDHSLFKECFDRVIHFLCSEESHDFHARFGGIWGRQLVAIDGSKIPLPNRRALLEKYGSIGRGSSSPTAIASIAYDVLNERVLDAQLEPISIDERTLARRHMCAIKNKVLTNLLYTLFVFDRGYASKELVEYIEDTIHARYLFRLRSKFNLEIDALPMPESPDDIKEYVIELWGRKVRVIKLLLSSGTVETLISNDFDLSKYDFGQCYSLRWPIEEDYKLIKEKIGLTNFRGYSENSVLQEFWISMLLANLVHAIKKESDGIIDHSINQKGNKNDYMTNANELTGRVCDYIDEYMDADSLTEKQAIIRYIINRAVACRVQDKKGSGESNPRTDPRKVKHHYNNKTTH